MLKRVWSMYAAVNGGPMSTTWVRHMSRKRTQDFKGGHRPSKKQAKLVIRQKRADSKKAIRSLLSPYGNPRTTFENDETWKIHDAKSSATGSTRKRRPKTESPKTESPKTESPKTESPRTESPKTKSTRAEKTHNQRMRGTFRKTSSAGDDDDPPKTNWSSWFNKSWNGTARRSNPKFDWGDAFRHTTKSGKAKRDTANEANSEDEACSVGLPKDRVVLGLLPKGPLKMKDVKNAFHLSALKWHPDKHQGPTQAAAAEKFKVCANAYNSLCSALSETS